MAKTRFYRVPTRVTGAASSSLTQELSPVSFTLCGMILNLQYSITTSGAPAAYNDYWDKGITRLNLTGLVENQGKSFFDFNGAGGGMRLPYHFSRSTLGRYAPRRPTVVANSQTAALNQISYVIHFGTQPRLPNGKRNWRDLSAGIPAINKGQLTLNGTWASFTNVLGAATTTTVSVVMDIWLYGVQAEDGDPPELWMPQAYPVWTMESVTFTATSTLFSSSHDVPSGGWLNAMYFLGTRGTNTPRDNQIFNSFRLWFLKENRDIITFGGRAGTSDVSGGDYWIAEQWGQFGMTDAPYSDDVANLSGGTAAVGVPSLNQTTDPGFWKIDLQEMSSKTHPLYGADTRRLATGDLRLDYGVATATNSQMDILYQRYELNSAHPANAAYL